MSSIRLIATDLDFTLLNEHFVLTETTKEILSRILDSGVEFANRQSAQKGILAQLDAICRGEFTDEELGQTLLAMKNSLRTIGDSLGATESWYLTQILSGGDVISAQQDIENLQELGREDLIEAAQRLQLDSVYFLTGKSGEENAQPTQGV